MIPAFPTRISSIWMQTICRGWQCLNLCPLMDGFRFLQQDEISTLKLQELSNDAEDGYIFRLDLHYPTHLHNNRCSMYSSTQQAVFPESAPHRKLTPTLLDKVKYVVHYHNLKLYLQLCLVVTKVH